MGSRKGRGVKIDHAAHLRCWDIGEKRIVGKFRAAGVVNNTATASNNIIVDFILGG